MLRGQTGQPSTWSFEETRGGQEFNGTYVRVGVGCACALAATSPLNKQKGVLCGRGQQFGKLENGILVIFESCYHISPRRERRSARAMPSLFHKPNTEGTHLLVPSLVLGDACSARVQYGVAGEATFWK